MSNLWFTEHYPPVYSIASNDSSQLYKNKTQKRKTYIYQLNSLPGPPRLGWGMPLLSLPWPLVEMLLAGGVQPPTCAEQYLPHRAISVITRTASMLEQEKNMTRSEWIEGKAPKIMTNLRTKILFMNNQCGRGSYMRRWAERDDLHVIIAAVKIAPQVLMPRGIHAATFWQYCYANCSLQLISCCLQSMQCANHIIRWAWLHNCTCMRLDLWPSRAFSPVADLELANRGGTRNFFAN